MKQVKVENADEHEYKYADAEIEKHKNPKSIESMKLNVRLENNRLLVILTSERSLKSNLKNPKNILMMTNTMLK